MRGSGENVIMSDTSVPLSPRQVLSSAERENDSFSVSDLARSQFGDNTNLYSPRNVGIISSQTHNSANERNDSLPPIPHDNGGRTQHGVTVRRAVNKCRRMSLVNTSKYTSTRSIGNMNIDEKSVISPFDRSVSSRNMDTSLNGSNPYLSPTSRSVRDSPQIRRNDSGHLT
jgi:hypothetical protein